MIDTIEKKMKWPHKKTITKNLSLHGNQQSTNRSNPHYYYGTDINNIDWDGEWISKPLNICSSQVKWAVQQEMCRTIDDFLSRRTRALLLDAAESIRIAPTVALLMAKELNHDEIWIKEQVALYYSVAQFYLLH